MSKEIDTVYRANNNKLVRKNQTEVFVESRINVLNESINKAEEEREIWFSDNSPYSKHQQEYLGDGIYNMKIELIMLLKCRKAITIVNEGKGE